MQGIKNVTSIGIYVANGRYRDVGVFKLATEKAIEFSREAFMRLCGDVLHSLPGIVSRLIPINGITEIQITAKLGKIAFSVAASR